MLGPLAERDARSATTTYRVGGTAASVQRTGEPRRPRARGGRGRRHAPSKSSWSGRGRTCSWPTAGSQVCACTSATALPPSGSMASSWSRRGRSRLPGAGAPQRRGGAHRARVGSRDTRLGRRCGPDERRRPRCQTADAPGRAAGSSRPLGGERAPRPAGALDLSYRHSSIGPYDRSARSALPPRDRRPRRCRPPASTRSSRWRREHQPGGQNAGSVFTNPPGDAAGRLIEAAGLKGFRVGSAAVSPKHANFIQADPGGSADDVERLIDEVRACVAQRCGVELRTELRLIGFEEVVVTDPRIQERRCPGAQRQRGSTARAGRHPARPVIASGRRRAPAPWPPSHSSLSSARTVVIAGAVQTPRSEILAVTGLDREPPLIDVDTGAMQRRLERLAWVGSSSVRREWPRRSRSRSSRGRRSRRRGSRAGGDALLDATGRVLADESSRPSSPSPRRRGAGSRAAGDHARGLDRSRCWRRRPSSRCRSCPVRQEIRGVDDRRGSCCA